MGYNSVSLKELINDTIDYRGKTPPKCDSGIPVVSAANVKNGKIVLDGKYLSVDLYEKWATRGFIKPGDILITTEAPVGEIAKVPNDQTYLTSRRVFALQVNNEVADETFIYYYLLTENVKRYFESISHGATVPRIYKDEVLDLKIKLPSLPTQQKIASILSAYDDLIENNNKRIALLEEMASELYKEWFVRLRFPNYQHTTMVDEIPEGWEKKRLDQVFDYISRGVTPKYKIGSNFFAINQKVNKGDILEKQYLKELDPSKSVPIEKFAHKSDILLNCLGEGTLGRVHFFWDENEKYPVDQHMSILRAKKESISYFIYMYLRSPLGQGRLNLMKVGGTNMTMLNLSDLKKFKILIPPINLIESFYNNLQPTIELKQKLLDKNKLLQQTRDLLLPRLISGKLEV